MSRKASCQARIAGCHGQWDHVRHPLHQGARMSRRTNPYLVYFLTGSVVHLTGAAALPVRPGGLMIPRRVLFASGDRFQVKLSPDGKQVSYLDTAGRVWTAPLSNPTQPNVLIPAPAGG